MTKSFLLFCLVFLLGSIIYVHAITGPSKVCIGATATLSDTAAGGFWSSSDTTIASIDSVSGIVTGFASGSVMITYTTSSGFTTSSLTVDAFPIAGTINGPDSVCAWAPAIYTASVPGGIWSVSNGKGTIDSAGNFTGMFQGYDTLYYIVTNSCGSDTATKAVWIRPLANADFIVGDADLCVGDTVKYFSGAAGGTWFSTNHSSLLFDTSKLVAIAPGNDTLYYRVENACGVDTALRFITLTEYPDAGIITGPSRLCVGQTITLTDTASKGIWRHRNSNTSTSGALSVTGLKEGTDTVSYRVTNSCGVDSTIWPLVINPLPQLPLITRTGNVLTVPEGYASYQWLLNNNPIPGATTNTITANTIGSYYVIVNNSFACSIISFPQTITEIACTTDDLQIYPNPVYTTLYLNWCKPVNIRITGITGKTTKAEHINQFDLTFLPNGIYQLSVFDEQGNKLRVQTIVKLSQ